MALLPLLALLLLAAAAASPPPPPPPPPPVAQRVAQLLSELSATEKLNQLLRASECTPATLAESGVGMCEWSFAWGSSPAEAAASRNAVMAGFLASGPGKRLGLLPALRTLATHGGEGFGTVFPQGQNQNKKTNKKTKLLGK